MNNHNEEKYALENAAAEIFLKLYNINHLDQFEIVERRESPDFVLKNKNGDLLGLEIAHLFYDSEEAKMLLGRSNNRTHGIETFDKFLDNLNNLLRHKETKKSIYESSYPTSLVIRNTSPLFGMSDVLRAKDLIYKPTGYKSVWFISKDEISEL
ncbi:hypothetical protein [Cohnella soli]|uniref:DUF2283 domain-containing protein n=1 Tax=Cohnella soli TaxID=425005 RepID=A0ABW0HZR1_9BACL